LSKEARVRIPLASDTITEEDLEALANWLTSKPSPRLTKGDLTREFEEQWADWLGYKHCVFVNSGTSALLLAFLALKETKKLAEGTKVVVPAVSWATDYSVPLILGFEPILCDVNLEDLAVDLEALETIFKHESPSALLLVSVLGLIPRCRK